MVNPCTDCPSTNKSCKSTASLKPRARFLVVGGNLSSHAVEMGRHMSLPAFDMFAKHMEESDFGDGDFSYCNYVRCEYNPDFYTTIDNKQVKKHCRHHLVAVINHNKPEVIISLGAEATSMVMGRAIKITKARGVPTWSEEFNCWVMATTNPHLVHIKPQHEGIFASDCRTLRRLVDFDYDPEAAGRSRLGDYSMVTDLQFLIDEDPAELSFDVETLGLRFASEDTDLMTIQLCPEPGRGYLIPWNHPESPIGKRQQQRLRGQLKTLLCDPDRAYFGQNLKFDVLWIWEALGFRGRIDHDSNMLAALIDENLQNKDLDTLTRLFCPQLAGYADYFNATYDKSRMDLVPLVDIVDYGVGDTDAALQVCHTLLEELDKDPALFNHYNKVSIPGLNAFVPIERRGQDTDGEALDDFERMLANEVSSSYRTLIDQVPKSILRLHAEKGLAFTRTDFLRDILFSHPDGLCLTPQVYTAGTVNLTPDKQVPSTSTKTHLPYFYDDYPFVRDLGEHIKYARLLSTNVRRFRDNYIVNGKVYPSYSLSTAVTGRTSSRDPNSQNYPKHGAMAKPYRAIFVPPPERIQIEADYSQAELRISADMANETVMLDIYRQNGDIHVSTAAVAKQMAMHDFLEMEPAEIAEGRRQAKAVNFGFLYGMWWKSFVGYAKTTYGVSFTDQEAERIRNDFFRLYSRLLPWHEDMKNFARQNGYVRSYSGRVRHLPMVYSDDEAVVSEALRQAINSPVQEFASSCGVMALARLEQNVNPEYLTAVGFVHDALYVNCEPQYLLWGARTLKHFMESNPIEEWFGIRMQVPLLSDVGFGMSGKDVYEMKGLSQEGDYDFAVHELPYDLPPQVIPPNNGRYRPEEYLLNYDLYEGTD